MNTRCAWTPTHILRGPHPLRGPLPLAKGAGPRFTPGLSSARRHRACCGRSQRFAAAPRPRAFVPFGNLTGRLAALPRPIAQRFRPLHCDRDDFALPDHRPVFRHRLRARGDFALPPTPRSALSGSKRVRHGRHPYCPNRKSGMGYGPAGDAVPGRTGGLLQPHDQRIAVGSRPSSRAALDGPKKQERNRRCQTRPTRSDSVT